jgi:hypothetical protein
LDGVYLIVNEGSFNPYGKPVGYIVKGFDIESDARLISYRIIK